MRPSCLAACCGAEPAVGSKVADLNCDATTDQRAYLAQAIVQTPSTAGTYVLWFRFRDDADGSPSHAVHLDLPHSNRAGDSSTQRWHFAGVVEVQP